MDGGNVNDDEFVQTLITDHSNFSEYVAGQKNNQASSEDSFMSAYRLTGMAKIGGITDFMETLLENNCKFIVFAHHLAVLNGIEEFVKKSKTGYIRIDGSAKVDERHERV